MEIQFARICWILKPVVANIDNIRCLDIRGSMAVCVWHKLSSNVVLSNGYMSILFSNLQTQFAYAFAKINIQNNPTFSCKVSGFSLVQNKYIVRLKGTNLPGAAKNIMDDRTLHELINIVVLGPRLRTHNEPAIHFIKFCPCPKFIYFYLS